MSKVYVLTFTENDDEIGGEIYGIYKTREGAEQAVKDYVEEREGGEDDLELQEHGLED